MIIKSVQILNTPYRDIYQKFHQLGYLNIFAYHTIHHKETYVIYMVFVLYVIIFINPNIFGYISYMKIVRLRNTFDVSCHRIETKWSKRKHGKPVYLIILFGMKICQSFTTRYYPLLHLFVAFIRSVSVHKIHH